MKRGFTIIEVMVSVAIFSVVMTVALGALLAMSQSDSRAEALKSAVNGLNFALDEMSRTARTGTAYDCAVVLPLSGSPAPHDCAGTPASSFAFIASDGTSRAYCLGSNGTCVSSGTGTVQCPAGSSCNILRYIYDPKTGISSFLPITSVSAVQVATMAFYVIGSCSKSGVGCTSDSIQPKVTILLSGTVNVGPNQTPAAFDIQTSATQRIYDQ